MMMFSLQNFARAAHQEFALALGESTTPLTLVEVQAMPHKGFGREPFSLIFRGHSPIVLPQKMYALTNDTIGKVSIFLVPIGRDQAGVLYQAVFN